MVFEQEKIKEPLPDIERPSIPEGEPKILEKQEVQEEKQEEIQEKAKATFPSSTALIQERKKQEFSRKIENILDQDLDPFYKELSSEQKEKIYQKKAQTIEEIKKVLEKGKNIAQRVLNLIRKFLRLLPKVNQFFLEKESKIKTEKVISLFEKERNIQL